MGTTTDMIKGYANEFAGTVMQGVGKIVGSDTLYDKGVAQELRGEAQVAIGRTRDGEDSATEDSAETIDRHH